MIFSLEVYSNSHLSIVIIWMSPEISMVCVIVAKFGTITCFPQQEGFTPLHVASSLGNLDFVNFLINEGASFNLVDAHGR